MPDMNQRLNEGPHGAHHIAADVRGQNFHAIDRQFQDLMRLYMEPGLLRQMTPHFERLGGLAGGRLDELAMIADKHPPVLQPRDRFGRDEDWIDYHPAYREMEKIAYEEFGLHAMSHRAGVLGMAEPAHPLVKYAFTYLFVQGEFGLMCPVSMSDTSNFTMKTHGSEELREKYGRRMISLDPAELMQGAQFMTEKAGGSDVGANELRAVPDGGHWRLHGEKWFCSNAGCDVAVLLARIEGDPPGTAGLTAFVVPRDLDDGSRNAFRIMRLKDKLGSKGMASGEIVFEGAVAYHLGALDQGLKQMLVMVNSSRISHLTRAAGMMRRCLNEAMVAARHRNAFGRAVIEHPLMRRQLLKLMAPTEQALSALMLAAAVSGEAATRPEAEQILRMLTPIAKYRACRDNVTVATGAMEARGGNGYIEDWPNARLVRDAHLGLLWEGTSNINALDAVQRAVGKVGAHSALRQDLTERLDDATGLPGQFRTRLETTLAQALRFAEEVADTPSKERFSRVAASALYHVTTAVLMANEGAHLAAAGGDARRMLMARFVLEHRLSDRPKLAADGGDWEEEAISALLDEQPVSLDRAASMLTA